MAETITVLVNFDEGIDEDLIIKDIECPKCGVVGDFTMIPEDEDFEGLDPDKERYVTLCQECNEVFQIDLDPDLFKASSTVYAQ